MGSLGEIMQLCRLCLVKDKVNIPIFEGAGDIRKISHKISACLPVKVAKDDKLPKKICDGCSLKLDVIYQFWNTSTASEKQLLEWVNNPSSLKGESQDSRTNVAEHIVLKQEIDNGDSEALDAGEFIDVNDSFENIGYTHDDDDDMSNENIAIKTENDSQSYIEPPRKKQKVVSLSSAESEEDADDPSDAYNRDDSDEEDNDISDAQPTFVNVSDADQQPGPSGVGKSSGDAPYLAKLLKNSDLAISILSPTVMKLKMKKSGEDWEKLDEYPCDVCSKVFYTEKALIEHDRTHDIFYSCDYCKYTFKKLLDYTLHLKEHSEDSLFHCTFCDFESEKVTEISTHVSKAHKNNSKYGCTICKKRFNNQKWFFEHKNFHTGEKPFNCDDCGKSFMYSRYLAAHKTNMHADGTTLHCKPGFQCAICKKQYQHRNSLRVHMNSHTGHFAVCDICGKKLSSKEKLKFHLRIHTGYKPHKCAFCDKAFTKKSMLIEHERIHTGEKPYNCINCDKNFSQRSSLVIHMRGHSGIRPFACHICEKTFVAKSMLNFHVKTCKGYKQ